MRLDNSSIAAAIRYEEIAPPEWVPKTAAHPPHALTTFYRIQALDGVENDAVLYRPKSNPLRPDVVVVSVHGSHGNFATKGTDQLALHLAAEGHSALAINTRQHDDGGYRDNFFDVRKDLEAAVAVARSLGFQSVVLHGFSLGNIQVQFYAATDWRKDIRGVVLTSMFADLPTKTRKILIADESKYSAMQAEAMALLASERRADPLRTRLALAPNRPELPLSAEHFLTYRSEDASVAFGSFWIKKIPRPVLLVRHENDPIVSSAELDRLTEACRSHGSLVTTIDSVTLPGATSAPGEAHVFASRREELARVVSQWLQKLS